MLTSFNHTSVCALEEEAQSENLYTSESFGLFSPDAVGMTVISRAEIF